MNCCMKRKATRCSFSMDEALCNDTISALLQHANPTITKAFVAEERISQPTTYFRSRTFCIGSLIEQKDLLRRLIVVPKACAFRLTILNCVDGTRCYTFVRSNVSQLSSVRRQSRTQ